MWKDYRLILALVICHDITQIIITELFLSVSCGCSLWHISHIIKTNSEYKNNSLAISVNTYFTVMFYSTLFLICNHIPPTGAKTNVFGSNTTGIGVFLLTLSWYFDRRETNPTLVCISPNRIPVKISNSVFRMGASPVVILCMYCTWNHRLEPIKITDNFYFFPCRYGDDDWQQKTSITLMSFKTKLFHSIEQSCV